MAKSVPSRGTKSAEVSSFESPKRRRSSGLHSESEINPKRALTESSLKLFHTDQKPFSESKTCGTSTFSVSGAIHPEASEEPVFGIGHSLPPPATRANLDCDSEADQVPDIRLSNTSSLYSSQDSQLQALLEDWNRDSHHELLPARVLKDRNSTGLHMRRSSKQAPPCVRYTESGGCESIEAKAYDNRSSNHELRFSCVSTELRLSNEPNSKRETPTLHVRGSGRFDGFSDLEDFGKDWTVEGTLGQSSPRKVAHYPRNDLQNVSETEQAPSMVMLLEDQPPSESGPIEINISQIESINVTSLEPAHGLTHVSSSMHLITQGFSPGCGPTPFNTPLMNGKVIAVDAPVSGKGAAQSLEPEPPSRRKLLLPSCMKPSQVIFRPAPPKESSHGLAGKQLVPVQEVGPSHSYPDENTSPVASEQCPSLLLSGNEDTENIENMLALLAIPEESNTQMATTNSGAGPSNTLVEIVSEEEYVLVGREVAEETLQQLKKEAREGLDLGDVDMEQCKKIIQDFSFNVQLR